MVQENKLLEEELLAFYTQNECVYIVGTVKTHGSSCYRWRTPSTSSTLKTPGASSTHYTSPDTVSVEDPSINVVKH